MDFFSEIQQEIERLKRNDNFRSFSLLEHKGGYIYRNNQKLINLASNDYLGLSQDNDLYEKFLATQKHVEFGLGSCSSRLLTGNSEAHEKLEFLLAHIFGTESALIFNSGYHANCGILPAISNKSTLILADKLIHASLIDGINMSTAKHIRFRHNDYAHLEGLLNKYASQFSRIIIVTESVFSMDGDTADLRRLITIKKKYDNILLYVDEAHAFGVMGKSGLGYAEQLNVIQDIDFLIGTFGKSIASMGAYIVCKQIIKDFLINKMRPLIFSTALPPLLMEWTFFVVSRLASFKDRREHLQKLSQQLISAIKECGYFCPSQSQIIPLIIGENNETLKKALLLQENSFFVLPIRPPSVPTGTSRIRISLSAEVKQEEIDMLIENIKTL